MEFEEGEGKAHLDAIAERVKKYQPKPKITYKMIQEYVARNYGFKVHTAYIAEEKRSLGLTKYDAPNAVDELKRPRKHQLYKKAYDIYLPLVDDVCRREVSEKELSYYCLDDKQTHINEKLKNGVLRKWGEKMNRSDNAEVRSQMLIYSTEDGLEK